MNFSHVRSKPIFFCLLVAGVAIGVSFRMFGGDVSNRTQPRPASFETKNEFRVQPKGTKTVRMWFAVPQEDAVSVVREFRVTADCLRTETGNCPDFHSLFASLAMAAGIPTRMVYGSLLKPTLNGVQIDGSYHCWIYFFAPNYGWLPLDVSLANIYGKVFPVTDKNKKLVELTTATGYKGLDPSKVDYYFGNLDERRVTWSMGRDLIMQPPQEDGPVNALAKMYVEIDGKQSTDWTRELTYAEATRESAKVVRRRSIANDYRPIVE